VHGPDQGYCADAAEQGVIDDGPRHHPSMAAAMM
jgi:hypothetical protein